MKVAIYPGSFDPITFGHLDLIDRALVLFDKLYVAIAVNPVKEPLFAVEERVAMVKQLTNNRKRVVVISFPGLLADLTRKLKAVAIIRGLRAVSDFEYEFQMALMNRKLYHGAESVFLMPSAKYVFLSSNLIKDVAKFGGDVSLFVPQLVERKLKQKFDF
ncbi:MAG: pantetheine-phosphate adenylyltransferase [candidate division Zixibacteria bacterium RBG_16_48_11]|nr:MAG: pantetheine-phosphate adenylyltransferase [candidate division Zixibacteria bacterium RBG_16_48_11]